MYNNKDIFQHRPLYMTNNSEGNANIDTPNHHEYAHVTTPQADSKVKRFPYNKYY